MSAKEDTDALGSTPLVPKKSGNPLVPVIAVVVLVPVLCYAVMDFVIIPKLKSAIGSAPAAEHGAPKKKTPTRKTPMEKAKVVKLQNSVLLLLTYLGEVHDIFAPILL